MWTTQFTFPFPRLIQTKAGCRVLETGRLCEKKLVMGSSRSDPFPSFFIFNPPNFIRINFSRASIHYSVFSFLVRPFPVHIQEITIGNDL